METREWICRLSISIEQEIFWMSVW